MQQLNEHHSFTGIQRDMTIAGHPSSFLYDAHNIRLTARGEDTLLTITNEIGPKDTNIAVTGTYLGHCLLGNYLVIFSTESVEETNSTVKAKAKARYIQSIQKSKDKPIIDPGGADIDGPTDHSTEDPIVSDPILPWKPLDRPDPIDNTDSDSNTDSENTEDNDDTNTENPEGTEGTETTGDNEDKGNNEDTIKPDYITRIDLSQGEVVVLYNGNLRFSVSYPIEAIASYENGNVQKVYWTDGYNQPRVINIVGKILDGVDSQFDFVRELALKEEVQIQKQLGASGSFAPGVIQYALTYYSKYGQESNIFYTSPLLYISYKDRGGSPEDKIENAFKITVKNLDSNFDYLRIYSIQRTSINGTPIVKRVQDISIKDLTTSVDSVGVSDNSVSFIDNGTVGDSIDPTELLFKGGESIVAETIEQKDNTLFLGNIRMDRPSLGADMKSSIASDVTIDQDTRTFYPTSVSEQGYVYFNQLTSFSDDTKSNSVPCGGFKRGDYYRCGIQFQYKDGKWSDPIWIKDEIITNKPSEARTTSIYKGVPKVVCSVTVPSLKGTLTPDISKKLHKLGYRKARAVVVFPEMQDRVTICQGVTCPTMYTESHRNDGDLHAQSSWFFRPIYGDTVKQIEPDGSVAPTSNSNLPYTNPFIGDDGHAVWYSDKIRQIEIQGNFDNDHMFFIDSSFVTLHSPDIEFDDRISTLDFVNTYFRTAGYINFITTFSDIDVQMETPTISNGGSGFLHKGFTKSGARGIVSGLFYEDYAVNNTNGKFEAYTEEKSVYKWLVYPWNKTGSLNNDINRPADAGTRTSVLKKKVISNLRYASSDLDILGTPIQLQDTPQIFNSDQMSIVKIGKNIYQGSVDALLSPSATEGMFFAFNSHDYTEKQVDTPFNSESWWKTYNRDSDNPDIPGLWRLTMYDNELAWEVEQSDIGKENLSLLVQREHVRMKYKSSPHMVLSDDSLNASKMEGKSILPIIEIIRNGDDDDKPFYRSTMFGGTSEDALKANAWIPCGEPVVLGSSYDGTPTDGATKIQYSYGDTYFQRWDCLKTYPFTPEDINQVVEIGSFMLETRVNIDGRYDRNRGQSSNLNMTPQNFNLLNPVYTQVNNFFTYRILDKAYYDINSYPNQITWTKEKQAGADVDLWTNITLASTYDMDGSKGAVVSLNTWKDQIYCFQDTGISNILFNSRVQIPTSDGVPIEISNSYKVDGYRYISDGIGCINKWTISRTPSGLYFIDSMSNHLHHIGDSMQDLATIHNMTSWFNNIEDNEVISTLHDNVNHDLYLLTSKEALCYSEILGQFTSFMNYDRIALVESNGNYIYTMRDSKLYWMFKGLPNDFFGNQKGWDFSFISNGIDNSTMDFDKIFSNIDYRMDMFNGPLYRPDKTLDYIHVTNEYQDTGEVPLSRLKVSTNPKSYHHNGTNLQKKFRIWRIQIPRNKNSLDRIRNPWCKIKLGSNGSDNLRAILYDLNVQYYL